MSHAHASAHTDQIQFEAQGLGLRGSDEGGIRALDLRQHRRHAQCASEGTHFLCAPPAIPMKPRFTGHALAPVDKTARAHVRSGITGEQVAAVTIQT